MKKAGDNRPSCVVHKVSRRFPSLLTLRESSGREHQLRAWIDRHGLVQLAQVYDEDQLLDLELEEATLARVGHTCFARHEAHPHAIAVMTRGGDEISFSQERPYG